MSNSPRDRYGLVSGHPLYDMSLHGSAIRIYAILCLHANSSAECWPSIKTIATDLKVSIRYIQKCLDELMAKGYIRKSARYGQESGQQLSNAYFLPHYPARGDEQMVPRGANNMFRGEGELIVHGGDEQLVHGEGEQSVPGGMNNMFTQTQENTPENKPEEHTQPAPAGCATLFADAAAPIEEPAKSSKKKSAKTKAASIDEFCITDSMKEWAETNGFNSNLLDQHLSYFKDYVKSKNNPYVDLSAAFRNCVRKNWAGLQNNIKNNPSSKPRILTRRDCDPGPIESYLHTDIHDKYGQTGLQQIPKAA